MTIGLVGRKCGMTRVFTDAGVTVPVTVVEALPNRITQVKSDKTDRKSTRLNSSHVVTSRMPSSA